TPQADDKIQSAVLLALVRSPDADAAGVLFKCWPTLTPSLRTQALEALLSRPEWTKLAILAFQSGKLLPGEIDAVRRQRLLDHKNGDIRAAAAKIFKQSGSADRAKIVAAYQPALKLKADPARGEKLFAKHCAVCHKLGGKGGDVGPDLASVGDKSPE